MSISIISRKSFPEGPLGFPSNSKDFQMMGCILSLSIIFMTTRAPIFTRCEIMGAWMDLGERKPTTLSPELSNNLDKLEHASDFKVLTKEDTRRHDQRPVDL